MSDPGEAVNDDGVSAKGPEIVEQVIDLDLLLLNTIYNANKERSLSITLHVPGGVVSGELIGRETYLELWDALAGAHGQASGLVGFQRAAEESPDAAGLLQTDDLPRWIHLRDAAVMTPTRLLTFPFWRGRLADVSGWALGAMRETPRPTD